MQFGRGDYKVMALPTVKSSDGADKKAGPVAVLTITAPQNDEGAAKYIPSVDLSPLVSTKHKFRDAVTAALVRAGARHPGLDDLSLRELHRAAHREGHVELFCDLNVLGTGLVGQLVDSLGQQCSRVVVSSSSIDILHEYEGQWPTDWQTAVNRAGMSRCLGVLEDLRRQVAVHVHPLPPGATGYMRRRRADPPSQPEESEGGVTYISEDRLMIAAFWHYIQTTNPRVPVRLVTSDFNLAHVCAAERVPFVFAKTPFEVWWKSELKEGKQAKPELIWIDPFSLKFRTSSINRILWELALVFGHLRVDVSAHPDSEGKATINEGFLLSFNHWAQLPGRPPAVTMGEPSDAGEGAKKIPMVVTAEPSKRKIKLSLQRVFEVMPTRVGGRVPMADFKPTDDDALRQLIQIGTTTELFSVSDKWVEGLPAVDKLLEALKRRDYIALNDIFRKIPAYDEVLADAGASKPFPDNRTGGAITGWAITLGAAYRTVSDGVQYGLAEIAEDKFEAAVLRYHSEIGRGDRSVPLPPILDRVCRSLQISPIRFEATLEATIGKRALEDFEVQRATVRYPIPKHSVVVAPSSAASASYIRDVDFGSGVTIGTRVVGALVARSMRGS